jgi:hypothetical protein
LSDRHGRSTLKRELDLLSEQHRFLITTTPPLDTLLDISRAHEPAKTQKREESKQIKMHRTYSMRQSRAPTVSPSLPSHFPHPPSAYLRIAGLRGKTETDALQASQLQNPPPPPSSTKSGRLFGKGGLGQCILDISYDVAFIHHHFPFSQLWDCENIKEAGEQRQK